MKIFITGVSGFIGRHLIRELEGNQILALSREKPINNSVSRTDWLIGGLDQPDLWESRLIKFDPDVCVHLAWHGLPDYSKEISENNVQLGMNLLNSLRKTVVKKIVALGSCWEYGDVQGQVKETQDVQPNNHFTQAKVQVCEMFAQHCRSAGISFVWPRIFFSYGPGQREVSLLPSVFDALKNGSTPTIKSPNLAQDFIYISDVAMALASLINENDAEGIFNVGNGQMTVVSDFVNLISIHCDSTFRMAVSDNSLGFCASIEKIKRVTGWEPRFTLEQGVLETVKELKKTSF